MCTVSAFFSVKCASGNYQLLKSVVSKLRWSQTACFEPLYRDVCSQILRPDQIWKRILKNLKNQCDVMSSLHWYAQTTCKFNYNPAYIIGVNFEEFRSFLSFLNFEVSWAAYIMVTLWCFQNTIRWWIKRVFWFKKQTITWRDVFKKK